MKSFLASAILLILSSHANAQENCAVSIIKNHFEQRDTLIKAFYKADVESKTAPTANERRKAAIIAMDLSREMEPEIRSLRSQEAIDAALAVNKPLLFKNFQLQITR